MVFDRILIADAARVLKMKTPARILWNRLGVNPSGAMRVARA